MAYIESGNVKTRRSLLRLSVFSDLFWALLNFIAVFIKTMFSLEASNAYGKKSSGRASGSGRGGDGGPGGGGPSGGSGRGPFNGSAKRGPRGLDNVRGIDHNALTPCGSCCGG